MRYYYPVLKLFSFVLMISCIIAKNTEYACKDPEPRVRFREFGDSGLKFQLLFWVEKPEMRGLCIDEVSSIIHKKFKEKNIVIPYPQHTLHIENSD